MFRIKIIMAMMLCFVMAAVISLSGCDINDNLTPTPMPTPPLFNSTDVNESLQSGNNLYGSFISSDGRYIYYISKDLLSLVRSNYDGSEAAIISNKTPISITCAGGKIFFISGTTAGPIYKIDYDGNGETMISDMPATDIVADGSNVFYINEADQHVYRINHDGSEKTIIYPNRADRIMLIGNNLFIQTLSNNVILYMLTPQNLELITPDSPANLADFASYRMSPFAQSVNITLSTPVFADSQYDAIYRINENGKVKKLTNLQTDQPFIASDGYIYYTDLSDNWRLYKLSIENADDRYMVVNDVLGKFAIIGNSVYYIRKNGNDIYRVSIDGGQSQKVT